MASTSSLSSLSNPAFIGSKISSEHAEKDHSLFCPGKQMSSHSAMSATTMALKIAAAGFPAYTRVRWETDQCWVAAKLFTTLAGLNPELLISESIQAFFSYMHKSTVK
ncbi:hypothetical protein OIU76_001324 [Salix suchowensis]|nr:hypothetical protein OIU76_001324 [Salix suchowensis]